MFDSDQSETVSVLTRLGASPPGRPVGHTRSACTYACSNIN